MKQEFKNIPVINEQGESTVEKAGTNVFKKIRSLTNKFRLLIAVVTCLTSVPGKSLAQQSQESDQRIYEQSTERCVKTMDDLENNTLKNPQEILDTLWKKCPYGTQLYPDHTVRFFLLRGKAKNATGRDAGDIRIASRKFQEIEAGCESGERNKESMTCKQVEILKPRIEEAVVSIKEPTPETYNPEELLQNLLSNYARQTGLTDKQAILEKIAFNEDDAKLSILLLEEAGKYEEADGLLTFYFQINPSLLDRSKPFMRIAAELLRKHGTRSAWDYYRSRQREKEWTQRWERILKVAIPVIAIGAAIKIDADQRRQEEERRAAEERRRAEEVERQRQAQRAAENERRRAEGRPTLEEEEAKEREEFIARCLEQCTTRYHECLGYVGTDKFRAHDINKCERSYAECRGGCK